jgi:hypothetical protein
MFKEMGQLMGLLKNVSKLQGETEKLQERLAALSAEGTAGGGMVTVNVSGKMQILSCHINDDAWKLNDKELLEDLIRGAANAALEKARLLVAEETAKMMQSMGLPAAGSGLPGLDGLTGLVGS